MADPAVQKLEATHEPASPATMRKLRLGALIVVGVLVAGGAWWVLGEVNKNRSLERWAQLDSIEAVYRDPYSTRSWLLPLQKSDLDAREKHAGRLEDFLAKAEGDEPLVAHVRARIADVRLSQAFGRLAAGGGGEEVDGYLAAAQAQLEILRDKHPDAPLNWTTFGRGTRDTGGAPAADAPSVIRRALTEIAKLRAWEKENALRAIEPDPDRVIVLRTEEGDLHLRTLGSVSPAAVRSLVDRACSGALDGVRIFERRDRRDSSDRTALSWLRVGGSQTKKDPTNDDDRLKWNDHSPGETRPPETGRFRILHTAGTVTSWHAVGENEDDPQQFLLVVRDSPDLDFEHTPFARLEGAASIATLARMAELRTFSRDQPDTQSRKPGLDDQLIVPVRIVKAIVYEKGAAEACTTPLTDDEKNLSTLKADAFRRIEAPAPPAPPTSGEAGMDTPPATPPAMSDKVDEGSK